MNITLYHSLNRIQQKGADGNSAPQPFLVKKAG